MALFLCFSSVDFLQTTVALLLSECPDVIQYQVWHSWSKVSVLVTKVCHPTPDHIPDDVPTCIETDYSSPDGVCAPSKALRCLGRVEEELFLETSTEDRFCVYVLLRIPVWCLPVYDAITALMLVMLGCATFIQPQPFLCLKIWSNLFQHLYWNIQLIQKQYFQQLKDVYSVC